MISLTRFIARVYALLLRLCPHEFRDEFGDEMQATLAEAISEATQHSLNAAMRSCAHELRELPADLTREYWTRFQKGNITMNTMPALLESLSQQNKTILME